MGGLGSGRRGTRTTVEDCLLLSAERLMHLKLFGPTLYNWGTLIWQNTAYRRDHRLRRVQRGHTQRQAMAQRGRPRKNGAKPGGMLGREVIALGAYDEARRRGEKHVVAISEAVSAVRDCDSKMPISETEVRRILAC